MSNTLAALALERAEQSASLRQGVTLSAGIHLTLAVLVFGALGMMRAEPTTRIVDFPGGVVIFDPPPPSDRGGVKLPDPTPTLPEAAVIVPVERDEERPIEDPPIVEPVGSGLEVGPNSGGETGNGSPPGVGIGLSGEEVLPKPKDFVPYDIEPEVIRRVVPTYPDMPRSIGMEGDVLVRVLIGKRGEVKAVEIERSSPMFDDAALNAVRQWTFRPAIASGNPVAVWIRIPIVFRMK